MISYLLLVLPSVIAFFSLAKDWKAHSSHWRRAIVFATIAAVLILGILNLRSTNKQHQRERNDLERHTAALDGNISDLKTSLHDSQAEAKTIGDVSTRTLDRLSDKVANLQAKILTSDLRAESDSLRQELRNTQRAMAPSPKTVLIFHVGEETNSDPTKSTTTVSLHAIDNHVLVPVMFVNPTSVDAVDGYTVIFICGACQFAHETSGWQRIQGAPSYQRNNDFQRYLARTESPTFTFDILIPEELSSFQIASDYRCKTCIVQESKITSINVLR